MKNYKIDFENEIWKLLLNDPIYKKHENEIKNYYSDTFKNRYGILKKTMKEITSNTKEKYMILNLFDKYKINSELFIFEGNELRGIRQSVIRVFDKKVIFINSKILSEIFLDFELKVIFAHEVAHIVHTTPIILPPLEYFKDLFFDKKTNHNDKCDYYRLVLISAMLTHIDEINADRFSIIENTSFEHFYCGMSKLIRIGNFDKKYKEHNIIKFISEYPKKRNKKFNVDSVLIGHPDIDKRFFSAYFFCKENNLIESKSLLKVPCNISMKEIINYDSFYNSLDKLETLKK